MGTPRCEAAQADSKTLWPLGARRIASTSERRVWHWLNRVFFDHHIMIKTPVTRFTMPQTGANGAHWHQLLSGVYCTFTICSSDGHVIGCVDVPGPSGISRSNRLLKLTLLSQCGISYCVVKADALPRLTEIRTEFLGDKAVRDSKERDLEMITAAHQKLRTAVDRGRNQRATDFGTLQAGSANGSGFGRELFDSDFISAALAAAQLFRGTARQPPRQAELNANAGPSEKPRRPRWPLVESG